MINVMIDRYNLTGVIVNAYLKAFSHDIRYFHGMSYVDISSGQTC